MIYTEIEEIGEG